MAVKLYIPEKLREVKGLYADRALEKMDGDIEVYSTLLDKFLNQLPRSVSKLRKHVKDENLKTYMEEIKALSIDLADIFALDVLSRAHMLCETAENGDNARCMQQIEPFVQAAQEFAYEVKQCRTQDELDHAEEAANKAAEMDIGGSMMKNKYASISKTKFVDLYRRIEAGLTEKASNLTSVLKAMGYDSAISEFISIIDSDLKQHRLKQALTSCGRLLNMLGCAIPEALKIFRILLIDSSRLGQRIESALGDGVTTITVSTMADLMARAENHPNFILVNTDVRGVDGLSAVRQLKAKFPDIPAALILPNATMDYLWSVRQAGAAEVFLQPLDESAFAEILKFYVSEFENM